MSGVIMNLFLHTSGILTQVVSTDIEGYITTINSEDLVSDDVPMMSIQIPSELINLFASGRSDGVRTISTLLYNVEAIFTSEEKGYAINTHLQNVVSDTDQV